MVKADRVWRRGIAGNGVTVAVLDSGVAADLDLIQPANRILASVNFADQRDTSDPGGHGTHIAGIIAGNGSRSGGEFVGIAPKANVVDVRVHWPEVASEIGQECVDLGFGNALTPSRISKKISN